MKKLRIVTTFVGLLCFSGLAFGFSFSGSKASQPKAAAPAPAPAAPAAQAMAGVKVGVVDINKILAESSQVKALRDKLKAEFQSRDASIAKAEKKLQASMKQLKRDASVMKSSKRKKLQDDIVAQQKSLQTQQIDFQRALYKAKQKGMSGILDQLKQTIELVSHKKGVNLVLTKSGLAFFENTYDITSAVADEFNNKS